MVVTDPLPLAQPTETCAFPASTPPPRALVRSLVTLRHSRGVGVGRVLDLGPDRGVRRNGRPPGGGDRGRDPVRAPRRPRRPGGDPRGRGRAVPGGRSRRPARSTGRDGSAVPGAHAGGARRPDRLRRAPARPLDPPRPGPGPAVGGRRRGRSLRAAGAPGSGGSAEVYRTLDRELGEVVALKLFHADSRERPEHRERYRREVRVTRRIRSRHVSSIHGVGRIGDRDFIVMDLVPGRTIGEWLDREGPFSEERTLDLALDALVGLSAAHEAGVVHRDLKPRTSWSRRTGTPSSSTSGSPSAPRTRGSRAPGSSSGPPRTSLRSR